MLENKVEELVKAADQRRQLVHTLNTIYDRINMKTGLILAGFDTVMAQLAPFLTGLANKKPKPAPQPQPEHHHHD